MEESRGLLSESCLLHAILFDIKALGNRICSCRDFQTKYEPKVRIA